MTEPNEPPGNVMLPAFIVEQAAATFDRLGNTTMAGMLREAQTDLSWVLKQALREFQSEAGRYRCCGLGFHSLEGLRAHIIYNVHRDDYPGDIDPHDEGDRAAEALDALEAGQATVLDVRAAGRPESLWHAGGTADSESDEKPL